MLLTKYHHCLSVCEDPELAGKGNVAVRLLVGDYGGDPRGGGADATLNGWPLYNARAPNLSSASVTNPTRGSTAGFRQVPLGSGGVSLGARVDAMLLALRWRLSWYHPTMSKAQVRTLTTTQGPHFALLCVLPVCADHRTCTVQA